MARTIAFVGNCQMQALQTLYDKFVAGYTRDRTFFLPSYQEIDQSALDSRGGIDLVVEQVQGVEPNPTLPESLRSVERCAVPLVSAAHLWPFAGEQHPNNGSHPYLEGGPYPGELGDGFLNRLILKGVSPDDALLQYQECKFSNQSLDRRYELTMDRQRRRDELSGFSIAPQIERFFRLEPLFLSPHHPGLRISLALAAQLFDRMGAPRISTELLNTHIRRSPFPHDELPIHPEVAGHFRLAYINAATTYSFRGEGRFSWEEWVLRYMGYSWEPHLYEGAAISESDPLRARDLLMGVVARLPNSPLARQSMAKALSKLGSGDDAFSEIEKALALDSEDPTSWRVAAFVSMQRGHHDEARNFAATAVARDPSRLENLGLLAKFQEDLGDFTGAEVTYRKMIFLAPYGSEVHTRLGTALMRQTGRSQEALAAYGRAIALDSNNAGAHFGASLVFAEIGKNEEAIQAVQNAVLAKPVVALYYSHLGHLLGRVGRRREAIDAFTQALAIEPGNAGIHNVTSDLMMQEGLRDEALHHIKLATQIAPRTLRFQIAYSQILEKVNRISEAIATLREALLIQPSDAALMLRLGLLLVQDGHLAEAATHLGEAFRLNPEDVEAPLELSRVLDRMGDVESARTIINAALGLRPSDEKLLGEQRRLGATGTRFIRVAAGKLAQTTEEIIPEVRITTPKCLVYTNFPQLNPEFARHHLDGLYTERERFLPSVLVGKLDESVELFVPNGEDFLPFCGAKVVADQVRPNWSDDQIGNARLTCERKAEIEGPALLIGRFGIRTWGHWLGELLPKIVAVEAAMPNRFRYILPDRILTDPVHRTALESLRYYGIEPTRLALVSGGTTYKATDLYVTSPVWSPDHMIHPRAAALMRSYNQPENISSAGPERVALLRRGVRTRSLINSDEIQTYLEQRGWAILDIEAMNFAQQVALFRSAKSVISVLGSGLTGIFYSPRNVKIMTLAPSHWGDLFFFALMQERNAKLADIRGTSIAATPSDVATASFSVDLAEIEHGLALLHDSDSSECAKGD